MATKTPATAVAAITTQRKAITHSASVNMRKTDCLRPGYSKPPSAASRYLWAGTKLQRT